MKILLSFIICMISGSVGCFDVIGYSGGSIKIFCNQQQNGRSAKYFCRKEPKQCFHAETEHSWVREDRVYLYYSTDALRVFYRDLRLEDAGLYLCGETGLWNYTVNLSVKTDPCCLRPKTVIGYLGETVTINCSYPEEFQTNTKTIYKWDDDYIPRSFLSTTSQIDRFSMSDNSRSNVVSVRISDVREDDGGVYYCAAWNGAVDNGPVSFDILFTGIQLQVKAPGSPTIIIISVSICVALLLIGGLTLIYKRRCFKTKDSPITIRRSETNEIVYENNLPGNQRNIRMGPIHQNIEHNSNQSDSVYQELDPRSRDSNSIYHTLHPNTNQTQSVRD
ncbi:hypothetical protein AMEX_G24768 [Astyanax mexicanus]|uniref:Ig-like domain-containing protein n=1 Tax=Astyanax mexicanus TaxID=7994 RepID=A0A8T2KU38_ASTMX|nr:hypothetical protein AMEX_G24768 [Astyanax mexicanus]